MYCESVTETQTNTQLLFCKKVNNKWSNQENISGISIFHGSRLTEKHSENWMMRKFPILRYDHGPITVKESQEN